ncbi:MAG TPA: VOC family protein [Pilimelia sp.]|nr:VOC family protein [Pilimelia sp.]
MINGGRRPIAPIRKLIAAVLGAVGAFVVLFGAGMTSWATAALGAALVALAVALVTVSGLGGGGRAWVAGSAHVVSASEPPANSLYGRCELQLVIDAPTMPAAAVRVRDPRVPVTKWPDAGATLPIMVAVDDPRHVRIQWDDVLSHAEAAEFASGEPGEDGAHLLDEEGHLLDEDVPGVEPLPPLDVDGERLGEPEPARAGSAHGATDRGGPDDARNSEGARPDDARPNGSRSAGTVSAGGRPPAAESTAAPVVVTETPAGPVVEGQLVDEPAGYPVPVQRRGADIETVDAVAEEAALSRLITAYPSARPGATGSIHGVGFTLLVADLERSIAFYRDLLGFYEIDGGEGSAVLASGDTRLVVRQVPGAAPVNRRTVHVNLEVGDVQATYQELRAKGVRFTYPPRAVSQGERLEQWAATFRDPDGHGVALIQWRPRPVGQR